MIFLNSLQAPKMGPKMGDFLENRIFQKFLGFASGFLGGIQTGLLGLLLSQIGVWGVSVCLSEQIHFKKNYMSEVQNPAMDSP